MEIKKKDVYANKYLPPFDVSVLSETETIVPDSKPDILKVLDISAELKSFNKSVTGNHVSVAGSIHYTVLYIPESASGISVINAVSAFSHSEDIDGISDSAYIAVTPSVEHTEYNLINSRKISLKSVVNLSFSITDKSRLSLLEDVGSDDTEYIRDSFKVLNRLIQKSGNININEQLMISPDKPEIDTILKSNADIFGKDVKVISNKAVVKGDLFVHTMYLTKNGEIEICENTVPFTEILDAEGISENSINKIHLMLSDFSASPTADSSGEMRILSLNAVIKADITGDEITDCETVNDIYSTSCNLVTDMSKIKVDEFHETAAASQSLKENISADSGNIASIYHISATPTALSASYQGANAVVKGELSLNILYTTQNPDIPVATLKTELPFEIKVPLQDMYATLVPTVEVSNICYNASPGNIELKADLEATLSCFSPKNINIINSVSCEEFGDSYSPSIVLYFVQKNDTLWDIAKRYHTKTNYIEELNNLNGSLEEGMQLLIPKG